MINIITIAMLYGSIIILAQFYSWGADLFTRLRGWVDKNLQLLVIVTLGCIASLLMLK